MHTNGHKLVTVPMCNVAALTPNLKVAVLGEIQSVIPWILINQNSLHPCMLFSLPYSHVLGPPNKLLH